MGLLGIHLVEQLILVPLLVFLTLGCLLGIAVGAGLMAASTRTLHLVQGMNRWVSTRRFAEPLDTARDLDSKVKRHRRVFGIVFALAGAYALFVLVGQPETGRLAAVLSAKTSNPVFVATFVEASRWLLAIGSVVAVAVGAMLAFVPQALERIEARANRWVSTEKFAASGDAMHTPLDRLVADHPRAAGGVILVFSLIVVIDFAILLAGRL